MLNYETLLGAALGRFPEFRAEYEKLVSADEIDRDTGVHIVFSYAFVPLMINAVETNDRKLAERLFSFVEEMAKSEDDRVAEVCDFTVLEELNDALSDEQLYSFMGEVTAEDFRLIKNYMR